MKFGKTIHVKEPGSAIDAVEEVTISDDLTQKVSLSANEETLQLSIAYKKGKFTFQRHSKRRFQDPARGSACEL